MGRYNKRDSPITLEEHMYFTDMCHEMCTPLTTISGVSQILYNTSCTPEQQRRYAEILHDSSLQLEELIQKVLESWYLESGIIKLSNNPLDLMHEIEKIVHIVTPQIEKKNLKFYVHIEPFHHLLVGDALRLRQIVLNLLSNAIKFTDKGYVKLDVCALPNAIGGWHLHIKVSDTGIGIAPERLSQVFGRYVQASETTYQKYGGAGLGLNICRSLAKMMDGDILVSSQLGKGSCFTAALNFADASDLQLQTPA
ncbi:MAG: ATP-binding protein [Alphaproteobacteria bacterium]|nr:ATP-binding protein [Alphaproteobacteria bacterium]